MNHTTLPPLPESRDPWQGFPQGVQPMTGAEYHPPARKPPRSGGGILKGILGGGFAVMMVMVIAEAAFITPLKPSTLIGTFQGNTEAVEVTAKKDEVADAEKQIAEARIEGERAAEARYQRELREIELGYQEEVRGLQSELDRTTQAYATLYQRTNAVVSAAMQQEAQLIDAQQRAIAAGQGGLAVGAQFADMGCLLGQAIGSPELQGACGVGQQIRQGMVREQTQAFNNYRSDVFRGVFSGLPDPALERVQADEASSGNNDMN
jgi:hypothetical protein